MANGVVYVGSADGNVYALNASTGAKLWSYATGSYVESSPAVANGVVYGASDNGDVYALNASTGAKLWSYATGGWDAPACFLAHSGGRGRFTSVPETVLYAFDSGWSAGTGRPLPAGGTLSNASPSGRPAHLCLPGMEPGT